MNESLNVSEIEIAQKKYTTAKENLFGLNDHYEPITSADNVVGIKNGLIDLLEARVALRKAQQDNFVPSGNQDQSYENVLHAQEITATRALSVLRGEAKDTFSEVPEVINQIAEERLEELRQSKAAAYKKNNQFQRTPGQLLIDYTILNPLDLYRRNISALKKHGRLHKTGFSEDRVFNISDDIRLHKRGTDNHFASYTCHFNKVFSVLNSNHQQWSSATSS